MQDYKGYILLYEYKAIVFKSILKKTKSLIIQISKNAMKIFIFGPNIWNNLGDRKGFERD